MQPVNSISSSSEVHGNWISFVGPPLQSSLTMPYFHIFLSIFVPAIPQELPQFYCITCFDTHVIFSTPLEVLFSSPGSRWGEKHFHAEQMCPDGFLFRFCQSVLKSKHLIRG